MNNQSLLASIQVPCLQNVNTRLPGVHILPGMRVFARFVGTRAGGPQFMTIGKYATTNGFGIPFCDQIVLLSAVFPNYMELTGYNTSEYVAIYSGTPGATEFLEILVYINRNTKFANHSLNARGGNTL